MIADLKKLIQKHWGFATFRPLQEDAMRAVLEGRDSVLVLPTGGGKSLCFQAPAVLRGGTTVVISPLIALMKDQVDGLQSCGVPAIQLDSSLSPAERFSYEQDVRDGAIRLLFVSPERLMMAEFQNLCRQIDVKTFAIDEAHCISHWGHDFRPEYRMLSRIKEIFPGANVHAYTATATEQVRADICKQLALTNPLVLVGNFDRPNLTYRVLRRGDVDKQVREVLERRKGESGIIYCLRRRDVDDMAATVKGWGYKAMAYHAGMEGDERRRVQEAFINEESDIIVATIAFGMGIDRSNIRFVLHTSMPKSVEHYQQETGRAGRDGLEAECVLLHSGQDFLTWKAILQKSAMENEVADDFLPNALRHAEDMDRYARGAVCRHKALVNYFGQKYEEPSCAACDLCLGDVEKVEDALVVAQKILSCVARVNERYGVNHVISVLRGEDTERVRQLQHDQLTTFGLLKEHAKTTVRDWIFQLIGQGFLMKSEDEYPVLKLNFASWEVMKGKQTKVQLLQPARKERTERVKRSHADESSWEGVDRDLADALRKWRFELAKQTGKPPYIIFSDATLRELARIRPSTPAKLLLVYGIGTRKIEDFGESLLACITDYCAEHDVPMDVVADAPPPPPKPAKTAAITPSRALAIKLFSEGAAIEDVAEQTGRARTTVTEYLCEYIQRDKPASVAMWVAPAIYNRVAAAVEEHGGARLKPLFIALEEKVPYDDIRIVVAHLNKK
ncbi:MAG: DNA helicase RecQ [Gemmataceae bacterium]|nr:DNA helicase RecQ [Gemmataceae bacterium]